MPMPPYPVLCACGASATFKIAARWSDGSTHELKTYSLCCEACLSDQLVASRRRRAACRTAPGETLDPPGVYELARGTRDRGLVRRADLESG